MQQMSQSTHDMSQANKLEADDKKAEQAKGANTPGDQTLHAQAPPPNSISHQGDVQQSTSNSPNSGITTGSSHGSQSQSLGAAPVMSDSGKPSISSGAVTPGNNQGAGAAPTMASSATTAPVVSASGKHNDLDSAHLKSFEQHLEQRYGAGSDKLTKDQKDALDKELKQDKQGMQQDFATGFNGVRDGMMGMIGKGQDQSVGAVQIRSSV
jgi:hypothetical protein